MSIPVECSVCWEFYGDVGMSATGDVDCPNCGATIRLSQYTFAETNIEDEQ